MNAEYLSNIKDTNLFITSNIALHNFSIRLVKVTVEVILFIISYFSNQLT